MEKKRGRPKKIKPEPSVEKPVEPEKPKEPEKKEPEDVTSDWYGGHNAGKTPAP